MGIFLIVATETAAASSSVGTPAWVLALPVMATILVAGIGAYQAIQVERIRKDVKADNKVTRQESLMRFQDDQDMISEGAAAIRELTTKIDYVRSEVRESRDKITEVAIVQGIQSDDIKEIKTDLRTIQAEQVDLRNRIDGLGYEKI